MLKKTSCFDLLRKEEESIKIITLCKELDNHLLGGIPSMSITEFCGAPGSGKTQMCLQLSINVQFPKLVGGIGGKALYIDTNQGFNPIRLKEIAVHMERRFEKTFKKVYSEPANSSSEFNVATLLKNVSYVYCADYVQLLAMIMTMKQRLSQDEKLKLIIIDSFSFPLRIIQETKERTHFVVEMLKELQELATTYEIAVVITNELTTKNIGEEWKICPALGYTHTQKVNQRVILSKDLKSNVHIALMNIPGAVEKVAVPFQIKSCGIRGVA